METVKQNLTISDLEGINNVISYTFNFSEAIDGLDENDFVITPANTGVSAQTVSFNDEKTEATVDFLVVGDVDDTFSITLPNGSYTDQGENGNREETTELPLNITIDTIAPSIISPVAGDYDVTTDSFTLTIDFSEALNLTDNPILTESNIVLNNATIEESTIDNNGSGGTGRVVIEAKIISLSGDRPTITINGSAYSDTLGNTGSNTYELTINSEVQEPAWLVAGECQNISFDGGNGTETDPYQISHICHLQNIDEDDITIDGVAYTNLLDKNYILVSGIDANYTSSWNNEQGFNPIGDNTDSFDGTFDGGGFTLSNLTIDRVDDDYIGVFGYSTGTIKDIVLDNTDITGNENVGGLVGQNEGTINSSIASGSVVGNTNVGGFVGTNNNGTYSDDTWCTPVNADSSLLAVGLNNGGDIDGITTYENCTIVVTANDVQNINDNLSGHYIVVNDIDLSTINNFNPIGNSSSNSFDGTFDGAGFTLSNLTINRSAEDYIGVFGYSTGTIKDITVDSVDITGNERIGGLVGSNYGTIANSSSSGSIVGEQFIGGIAGWNDGTGTIDNSSSSGSVVSVSLASNIGGFVGRNYGTIENSSSSGSVIGKNIVGGFVGSAESGSLISNSSSSGSVVGNNTVGGFVGFHLGASYMGNTWCKPVNSTLSAISFGNATGIATLDENCK